MTATAREEIAQRVVEGEMMAAGVVSSVDGILIAEVSGHDFMVEVRVLDVTE